MKKNSALELTYGAVFICLMTIGANISIWFPFLAIPIGGISVPLSLQTFFAILAGLLLGKRLGTFSMTGYVLIGLIGVPVFARMQAGFFVLFDYTGGFILGFVLVAFFTGWLAERTKKITISKSFMIALVGVSINYLIGVNYMFLAMNTWLELSIPYSVAWLSMLPFLVKDIVIAFIAAVIMIKIINRLPKQPRPNLN